MSCTVQSIHLTVGTVLVIYCFQWSSGVERSSVSRTAALKAKTKTKDLNTEAKAKGLTLKDKAKDLSLKAKVKDIPYCPRGASRTPTLKFDIVNCK